MDGLETLLRGNLFPCLSTHGTKTVDRNSGCITSKLNPTQNMTRGTFARICIFRASALLTPPIFVLKAVEESLRYFMASVFSIQKSNIAPGSWQGSHFSSGIWTVRSGLHVTLWCEHLDYPQVQQKGLSSKEVQARNSYTVSRQAGNYRK